MKIPLASYGRKEIRIACAITMGLTVVAAYFLPTILWVPILAGLASVAFFRDPERPVPGDPSVLVAPADGRVVAVDRVTDLEGGLGEEAIRIAIFLSVLDVHVNRSPCAAVVVSKQRRPGGFVNALKAQASVENERCDLLLRCDDRGGLTVLVRQIAGLIARRIVCAVEPGDRLGRGERFGMIKFGSRTEVHVPARSGFVPSVQIGDRVRAGSSILGRLEPHQPDLEPEAWSPKPGAWSLKPGA